MGLIQGGKSSRPDIHWSGHELIPLHKVPGPIRRLLKRPVHGCYSLYGYYSSARRAGRPYEFVYILSHMRSGSSLLTHLLVSNPDICGFGEAHIRYSTPRSFNTLIGKVLFTLRRTPGSVSERYVLDKVLHNYLLTYENVNLLCDEKSRVIFLLREPAATLPSIMKFLNYSEQQALDYYISRLAMLEKNARELSRHKHCVMLTHDQLLYSTDKIFGMLERFLALQQPLSETYQVLRTTGRGGTGDPSKNIRAGFIVREQTKPKAAQISPESLNSAWQAFEHCRATLAQYCESVDSEQSEACEAALPPMSAS